MNIELKLHVYSKASPLLQSDVMNQSMLDLIHAEDREQFMRQMQIYQQDPVPPPAEEGDPPIMPEYIKRGLTPEAFKGVLDRVARRLHSTGRKI